jgi:indolepyruvate ferredoxin oxidoreductase
VAAHMEGKGIVTQDAAGLAQKGGATWSHVLIADRQEDIRTTRVSMAAADLVIGCDPIVAAGKETALRMLQGRTHVALNSHATPTAAFVKNGGWQNPAEQCVASITQSVGVDAVGAFDADGMATTLLGDSIFINPMVLGYAWQRGWIPLRRESLMRAMELNAVAVEQNKTAFEWGRQAAHDWDRVKALLSPAQVIEFKPRDTLETLLRRRVAFLTDYQNAAYAQRYEALVRRVQQAEGAALGAGKTALAETVARQLFRLMAYKDEYEVARLYTDGAFQKKLAEQFEGEFTLRFHLAPPLLAKKNARGELVKQTYGPWMMKAFGLLARLKGLRGTALDVFGYTEERRTERALIGEYMDIVEELISTLDAKRHPLALEIAQVPERIKGFGHVKDRNLRAARERWQTLLGQWRGARSLHGSSPSEAVKAA